VKWKRYVVIVDEEESGARRIGTEMTRRNGRIFKGELIF